MKEKLFLRILRQWYGSRPDRAGNYIDIELLPPVIAVAVTSSPNITAVTVSVKGSVPAVDISDQSNNLKVNESKVKTTPGNPFN